MGDRRTQQPFACLLLSLAIVACDLLSYWCTVLPYDSWCVVFIVRIIESYFLNATCASPKAELAQSVERTTLNRVVVGSIPTFGEFPFTPPYS